MEVPANPPCKVRNEVINCKITVFAESDWSPVQLIGEPNKFNKIKSGIKGIKSRWSGLSGLVCGQGLVENERDCE